MILTYYLTCIVYCFYQLFSKYKKHYDVNLTGNSPELDTIMIILMGWILAPIDVTLTLIRWIKEFKRKEVL